MAPKLKLVPSKKREPLDKRVSRLEQQFKDFSHRQLFFIFGIIIILLSIGVVWII